MFTPRLTKPESGNPYYNTVSNGGYSGAIIGKPTDIGCNVLANCVGYAAGRFNEIIGKKKFVYFKVPPNAEDFVDTAMLSGLEVGKEPKQGAIICWAKGKPGDSSDGAGHVAVVEEIKSDGSIITSESGYGCNNPFWTQHRYKESGNWGQPSTYTFLGFIYLPDTNPYQEPTGVIQRGMSGKGVKWLQYELCLHGYLRGSEVDGDFGNITFGALLAFQFDSGLEVDGIAGPATKAALKQ